MIIPNHANVEDCAGGVLTNTPLILLILFLRFFKDTTPEHVEVFEKYGAPPQAIGEQC
jgi:hypothetical protein